MLLNTAAQPAVSTRQGQLFTVHFVTSTVHQLQQQQYHCSADHHPTNNYTLKVITNNKGVAKNRI